MQIPVGVQTRRHKVDSTPERHRGLQANGIEEGQANGGAHVDTANRPAASVNAVDEGLGAPCTASASQCTSWSPEPKQPPRCDVQQATTQADHRPALAHCASAAHLSVRNAPQSLERERQRCAEPEQFDGLCRWVSMSGGETRFQALSALRRFAHSADSSGIVCPKTCTLCMDLSPP